MDASKNFRDNLRTVLDSQRGMRTHVSATAGIGITYLSNVLSGRREPGITIAASIAAAMGLKLDDLLRSPEDFARRLQRFAKN